MKKQADRRAIAVSAALTLLILLGIGGVVLLSGNPLAAAANDKPASVVPSADSRQTVTPLTAASTGDPVCGSPERPAEASILEDYPNIYSVRQTRLPAPLTGRYHVAGRIHRPAVPATSQRPSRRTDPHAAASPVHGALSCSRAI